MQVNCVICGGSNGTNVDIDSNTNIKQSFNYLFPLENSSLNEVNYTYFCPVCLELFKQVSDKIRIMRQLEKELNEFKDKILSFLSQSQTHFSRLCNSEDLRCFELNKNICKELNVQPLSELSKFDQDVTIEQLSSDTNIKEEKSRSDEEYDGNWTMEFPNTPLSESSFQYQNDLTINDAILPKRTTRSTRKRVKHYTQEQLKFLINESMKKIAIVPLRRIEDLSKEEYSNLLNFSHYDHPKRREVSEEFKLIGAKEKGRDHEFDDSSSEMTGPFNCKTCDFVGNTKIKLSKHTYKVHMEKEKKICCSYCGKLFTENNHYLRHVKSVHEINEVTCDVCGIKFKNLHCLIGHKNRIHGLKDAKCKICGMTFKYGRVYEIRTHMEEVHGKAKKSYTCSQCPMNFPTNAKLKRHVFIVHTEERSFPCEICGKIFKEPKNVQAHIKAIHKKEKPHACSICGMKFHSTSHRNRHETVHSTERPHLCHICGKGFKHQQWLSHHKRSEHDGAYNYTKKKKNV